MAEPGRRRESRRQPCPVRRSGSFDGAHFWLDPLWHSDTSLAIGESASRAAQHSGRHTTMRIDRMPRLPSRYFDQAKRSVASAVCTRDRRSIKPCRSALDPRSGPSFSQIAQRKMSAIKDANATIPISLHGRTITVAAHYRLDSELILFLHDCGLVSRGFAEQSLEEFTQYGFAALLADLEESEEDDRRAWGSWARSCEPAALHAAARSLVVWSDSGVLAERYRRLRSREYLYCASGRLPDHLNGIVTHKRRTASPNPATSR